jgi:hypothetical protein
VSRCRYYAAGKCLSGARCLFLHSEFCAPTPPPNFIRTSISWISSPPPSIVSERLLTTILIKSVSETGRGVDLPEFRQREIKEAAEGLGFFFPGAMSLRRQLIRQQTASEHEYWNTRDMGNSAAAQLHASRFEAAVACFLRSSGVTFLVEAELKSLGSSNTPDFYIPGGCLINETAVFWIDCKTFYGAAIIAGDCKQPVGKLRATALRYNEAFGSGCFIFLCGFGEDLAISADLTGLVLLLDATPLDRVALFS